MPHKVAGVCAVVLWQMAQWGMMTPDIEDIGMGVLKIRTEKQEDKARVATLLARTYRAEGVKAIELAGEIRRQPARDMSLAMVAEDDGEAIACAMFTPVTVGSQQKAVVLASLGFDTKKEQLDVFAVLNGVLDKVKDQGHRYVLMRGDAKTFGQQGFVRSQDMGLTFTGKESDWLVKDLDPEASGKVSGKVELPAYLL
ncbi:MAG: hypothetical protein WAX89_03180 [Alphaproteobacteria bacterium]